MIPIAFPMIGSDEQKAVVQVLESRHLVQGGVVEEFENSFAKYIGVKHAVATSNGTTALELAIKSSGINDGEIITTPFSFISSSNSILFSGARPVFADINESYTINPDEIEKRVTDKTRAIMPVHLYGNPCDMKSIMEIAERHDLVVIEDSCQAHGAEYNGKKVGSFGVGCFSFYPTKNMTTGEGGIITTDNSDVADTARLLRNHGQDKRYSHKIVGYNYRMTDIAAAIGVQQLRKLDDMNKKRIENAHKLTSGLKNIKGVIIPETKDGLKHVFHQYTVRVNKDFPVSRDELSNILTKNNIGNAVHYPIPIHMQESYKKLGYSESLPISEIFSREVISLPVHPGLTEADIENIIDVIRSVK